MVHRRPKAGDAPHEGLLKVESRGFRVLGGFRSLGLWGLGLWCLVFWCLGFWCFGVYVRNIWPSRTWPE